MIRKLQYLMLSVLLCVALLPVTTAAAVDTPAAISLKASSMSVNVNDKVTVMIEGRNLNKLYADEIGISYDDRFLEYDSESATHAMKDAFGFDQESENKVLLVQTQLGNQSGVSGSHTLHTITFKALKSGTTAVRLAGAKLVNDQQGTMVSTLEGSLTITVGTGGSPDPDPDPDPDPNPGPSPEPDPDTGDGDDSNPAPALVSDNNIVVETELGENGIASVTINAEDLSKAIERAVDRTVIITAQPAEGAKVVQVNLPVQQMIAAGKQTVDVIKVDTGFATVALSSKLFNKGSAAEAQNVLISVAKVDAEALPADVKAALGDDVEIFDFNLSIDGSKVSTFDGNEVSVELPYTIKPEENPNKVVIYYISDEGKLVVVKNGKFNAATGKVEFKPKHFSKYAAAYVNVAFADLDGVEWAKDAVEGLFARGIVEGVGDDRFKPDARVTREEFVAMLVNTFDLADADAETTLLDVENGAWYYTAIASAHKLGIVNGRTDTMFGVHETITRQDMAVMVDRTLQVLNIPIEPVNGSSTFADQADISGYAVSAVAAMQAAGLIEGMEKGAFAPKSDTTRAQSAMLIYRLL